MPNRINEARNYQNWTRNGKDTPVGDFEKLENYIDRYIIDVNQTSCMKIALAILYGEPISDTP